MPTFDYVFDPTGQNPANRVTNEINVLVAANFRDYHFFVPRFAPFFETGLSFTFHDTNGNLVPLTEGIDWYLAYEFIGASRGCANPVYGGIQFLNTALTGTLTLNYQTIGGKWTLSEAQIAEILANRLENPRITSWEQVAGVPDVFPVINHEWDLVDQVGLSEVSDQLMSISDNLRQQGDGGLADHIADHNNPHVTNKTQVGLAQVRNLPTADQTTAVTGTSDDFYMTPRSVNQAMTVNIIQPFNAHISAVNPHGTGAHDVGTYTSAELDTMLAGKLSTNQAAADSAKLGGRTYPEVRDDILTGTAANAITLGGLSVTQLTSQVLNGTAANSQKFNGLTFTDMVSQLDSRYGGAGGSTNQGYWQYRDGTGSATAIWMSLGSIDLPDPETSFVPFNDAQWMVSGIQADDRLSSAVYLLRMDVRDSNLLTVSRIMGPDVTASEIGYTISEDGLVATIWLKSDPGFQSITITELSRNVSAFTTSAPVTLIEPTGITYSEAVSAFATSAELSAVIQAMTNAFTALAA